MILGIGIDLINVDRVLNLLQDFAQKFERKIFTASEIDKAQKIIAQKRAIFYAKRFAAKEAFAKACGLGIGRGINFCDIEIYNDDLGKPFIRLLNDKEKFLQQHFGFGDQKIAIHLSLTDEEKVAQAMVVIEKL